MNIGVELEFTGITRACASDIISRVLDGKKRYSLDEHKSSACVIDTSSGEWVVKRDRSIKPVLDFQATKEAGYAVDEDYMCELVTPVLDDHKDIHYFYQVLQALLMNGAVASHTCAMHIHIDFQNSYDWVQNLIKNVMYNNETVHKDFGVPIKRREYCKPYRLEFLFSLAERVKRENPRASLLEYLYSELSKGKPRDNVKNPARYYWVNFDSVYKRDTVEVRLFNMTFSQKVFDWYLDFIKDLICF